MMVVQNLLLRPGLRSLVLSTTTKPMGCVKGRVLFSSFRGVPIKTLGVQSQASGLYGLTGEERKFRS